MNEYNYIINGMDYMLNEQPSRHEIPRDILTRNDVGRQPNAGSILPVRAVLIAVINLLTR